MKAIDIFKRRGVNRVASRHGLFKDVLRWFSSACFSLKHGERATER